MRCWWGARACGKAHRDAQEASPRYRYVRRMTSMTGDGRSGRKGCCPRSTQNSSKVDERGTDRRNAVLRSRWRAGPLRRPNGGQRRRRHLSRFRRVERDGAFGTPVLVPEPLPVAIRSRNPNLPFRQRSLSLRLANPFRARSRSTRLASDVSIRDRTSATASAMARRGVVKPHRYSVS
jgi:hypothetical protein